MKNNGCDLNRTRFWSWNLNLLALKCCIEICHMCDYSPVDDFDILWLEDSNKKNVCNVCYACVLPSFCLALTFFSLSSCSLWAIKLPIGPRAAQNDGKPILKRDLQAKQALDPTCDKHTMSFAQPFMVLFCFFFFRFCIFCGWWSPKDCSFAGRRTFLHNATKFT